MKTCIICFAFMLSNVLVAQQNNKLTIIVENATKNDGEVLMGVYTKSNFMKAAPEYSDSKNATNKKVSFVFENIKDGYYAASCYQDSNGNKKMDFKSNGMPTEIYGVSNNPVLMGPPSWEDAKFEVKKDTALTIRM